MIAGIGIDITEIERIKLAIEKNPNFLTRTLTTDEIAALANLSEKRKLEFIAGRFSAKESYSKAMGSGLGATVSLLDLTILNNELGKPVVTKHPFNGQAHLSISHTDKLVMTEVILEKGDITDGSFNDAE
ncbi:holo-ACP synthase [Lentilactobacillus kosonis]|uniref:Holo-[acyl-carrier-protein] synthase n=1 Tax=Lentilactobacillus kosonis TaxID=2810561 RepID=A0A401FPA4_9LACO|nr:holo-ACP synthase [Lentilactobacillus kosonis]GAY74183.1 Holo-[acyl-carrier protein] synthase [Lentilactobacillus kosonis]